MGTLARQTVLVMWVWLMLAGVCLGKQVYLKDGSIVECESVWRRGDLIVVKINRDTLVEFERREIDLRRTSLPGGQKPHRKVRKRTGALSMPGVAKTAAAAVPGPEQAKAPMAAATQQTKQDPPPQARPAVKPVSPPPTEVAPQTPAPPAPDTSTSPAPPALPLDKAEAEQRHKQATEMMAEAIKNKDTELMKKALVLQQSAMQQKAMQQNNPLPGGSIRFLLFLLAVCLLIVVSMWVVFEKAGSSGWKSLVPIYNMYVLMEVSGKPGWWFVLLFIPLVGTVFYLMAMLALAERFGRGALFGIGLTFLPMIFFPLLAFGGSKPEEFDFA